MKNKQKDYSQKIETCIHCGSIDIDYGAIEFEDNFLYYPYTCNKCKKSGKEWYDLKFSENTK